MADEEDLPVSSGVDEDAPAIDPRTTWTLQQRIEHLEAQNDGLKRVGGLGLALVLLLGVLLVQQVYSDLRSTSTKAITLLKTDTSELAVAITPDNKGRLQVLPAKFGVLNPPQPLPEKFNGSAFYDSAGKLRMVIGEEGDGSTVFAVFDPVRGLVYHPLDDLKPGSGLPPAPPAAPAAPGGKPAPATTPLPRPSATP